jgi:hypothetical protein
MIFRSNCHGREPVGIYYQVLFEERDPDSEQDRLGGKYLFIQRQFELPNGSRIYVESHD